MEGENGNGTGRHALHEHSCFGCGARWWCLDGCLDQCGCCGKPRCPHWPCARCRDYSLVEHYHQPVVGGEEG